MAYQQFKDSKPHRLIQVSFGSMTIMLLTIKDQNLRYQTRIILAQTGTVPNHISILYVRMLIHILWNNLGWKEKRKKEEDKGGRGGDIGEGRGVNGGEEVEEEETMKKEEEKKRRRDIHI